MTGQPRRLLGLALSILPLAWACGGTEVPQAAQEAHEAVTTAASDTMVQETGSAELPGQLALVGGVGAEHWTGPGGKAFEVTSRSSEQEAGHPRRFGTITLLTALRERPVSQYPCTSCHFGRTVVMSDERIEDAHSNIQPVHPDQTGAVCSTCHSADNVELLKVEEGNQATLEQSYRLCARCHFSQVESWAGGAHGKRLDGWAGRRVVMGCGDCHDPHDPSIEQRIPFQAPRLGRSGGNHR